LIDLGFEIKRGFPLPRDFYSKCFTKYFSKDIEYVVEHVSGHAISTREEGFQRKIKLD
jgi:hypothetical protein